jgi:hypothetical protein
VLKFNITPETSYVACCTRLGSKRVKFYSVTKNTLNDCMFN